MKLKLTTLSISLALSVYAQTPPLGSPPAANTAARAASAWYRGGNVALATTPPGANIFGTKWNSPIFTQTNGFTRTRLNGDLTLPSLFGVNQNVSGYFGISYNPGVASFFDTNSPWAKLHLEGPNNTIFAGGQWRRWMRTGTFMHENSDAMYV